MNIFNYKKINIILLVIVIVCFSSNCKVYNNMDANLQYNEVEDYINETTDYIERDNFIAVKFSISQNTNNNKELVIVEAFKNNLKKEHSVKYYSYIEHIDESCNFSYKDVFGNRRDMNINENIPKNNIVFDDEEGILSKIAPKGFNMSYGIDVSKHNGNIDFDKVKNAGFEFAFIRIAYRGYGKNGSLNIDDKYQDNIKKAKKAGLKVGVYFFSQAINDKEALEEAKFVLDILNGEKLDFPVVFDPETIKEDIARTDNVDGNQFTKNAILFMDEMIYHGYDAAFYTNMVWEDYYFDMEKLKDYKIWYADYNNIPQTPYYFNYWQFSDKGIVDGINGLVDLNVYLEKK